MNRVILCGRLTRGPEIRYSNNSQSQEPYGIARFTLAVERRFKRDGDSTADFINCTAFGKTAEIIEKYCKQGMKLIVEGRWQTGNYTDKNGNRVFTNDCMIESIEFAESKKESNNAGFTPGTTPAPNPAPTPQANNGFMNIPSGFEELPFN